MDSVYLKKVGESIRAKRKLLGFTQESLAFQSKLSVNYIRKIEKGLVNPSLNTLLKIAKTLRRELSDIVNF